jgi:hypothetical protein
MGGERAGRSSDAERSPVPGWAAAADGPVTAHHRLPTRTTMTRPKHFIRTAPIAAALAALALQAGPALATEPATTTETTPGDPSTTPVTEVFRPTNTTNQKLFFDPEGVPAEEVQSARVRLHSKRVGHTWTRPVGVERVRDALESSSRLVLRRARKARGRLKIKVGDAPVTGEEPPSDPPATEPPPGGDIPTNWQRVASFENSLNEGTQFGWTIPSPHQVTRTDEGGAADGSYAAKITTNGGSTGCSCPRMGFEDGFSYGPGDEVWISGSWKIPNPSKLNWSRLMNLGHYEGSGGDNWYLALESTKAGTFQVSHAPYGTPNTAILPARPIPANRWFRVDLHFKLSPHSGDALTEWYIDGELVDSTDRANMYNAKPLHFFNGGLPYFWPGNGDSTVFFDAPRLTEIR